MPKVSPLQGNFNAGEISPLMGGRVDADRYKAALARCLNYIPTLQGGATRRAATSFVSAVKDSTKKPRLMSFEFSVTQAYVLEFGNQYIRFYKNNALITEATKNITGATQANPVVITSNAHGYSNGDRVIISGVLGMTQIDNREFIVASVAANTFELKDVNGTNVNGTGYGAYVSGGTVAKVYEISSPYLEADLYQLKVTQSADILYIAHSTYAPRKLSRTSHTSWTLTTIEFSDGPYLNTNATNYTLVPSATTGAGITIEAGPNSGISGAANNGAGLIRITATGHGFSTGASVFIKGVTGTTEANGIWTVTKVDVDHVDLQGSTFTNAYVAAGTIQPNFFASTDVGRLIRIKHSSTWGYAVVTAFTDPGLVTAEVKSAFGATTTSTNWRLGVWSTRTGWPSCVTFHEDRLFWAGATNSPQRLDGSKSGDYENMAPTATDGTVASDNAVGFSLNANDVNLIRWMVSDEKGLLVGTVGGEWAVRAASLQEALSPTNISAKRATSYGSANVQPVQVGKAALFVQRAGRKIREMTYFFDVDGFRAIDMTELSEHITESGLVQLAYQKEPQPIVWGVRTDGVLTGMTYDRNVDTLRVGWARHIIGGIGDAAGGNPIVESVATIPAPDGTREEAWVLVKRYINGQTVRYVEYLTKTFDDTDDQQDAFFVDCGLTYDVPKTISAITKANPAVVTANTHGFSNGDVVLINEVSGMTEVNGNTYTVANKAANTFELLSTNSSAYTTYVSGGEVRKLVSSVAGLNHLEGQTVSILADGAVLPDAVVTLGTVTLTNPSAVVHVGYNYDSDGQLLRLEAGAADGTALGKTRRMHRVGLLLHRSLGLKIGMSFDDLTTITFRTSSDPMTRAPGLFTGILSETVTADYDFENQFCWRQSQPLPSTVLAVMPQMVTQDRG